MKHYDLRFDVPAFAFINAQLMALLEHGGTFLEAKQKLFSESPYATAGLSVENHKFFHPSLVISLLFCTIVVPREFLDLPASDKIYANFDIEKIPELFTIAKPSPISSYVFLQCLRNSVSHALFSISEQAGEAQYRFWTERRPILDATICHSNLISFVETVGKTLTNLVLMRKK